MNDDYYSCRLLLLTCLLRPAIAPGVFHQPPKGRLPMMIADQASADTEGSTGTEVQIVPKVWRVTTPWISLQDLKSCDSDSSFF